MKTWKVEENVQERLDSYISKIFPEYSRTRIQKMLKQGQILVNTKQEKASYLVKTEDSITIEELEPKETKLVAQELEVPVLYEDKDIIVVNKPKRMVVHPAFR